MPHRTVPGLRPRRLVMRRLLSAAALCALGLGGVAAARPARKAPGAAKKGPPGLAAKKGAAPSGEGTILSASREVQVRADAAADWKELEVGQAVARRDRLRTGKAGTASLEAGGARLWLDPGTHILLLGDKAKKGRSGIELVEGSLRAAVDTSGPAGKTRLLRLQIGDSEVRVRGTARVQAGPGAGELQVAVYDGAAEVAGRKGPLQKLAAGSGLSLRRGAKARVGGLLGAPAWDGDGGLYFAVPQRGGSSAADLQLPFKPAPGAARYRLEIGRDEAMTDRVHVGSVSAEARVATAKVQGKGRFFVRLQAVDGDHVPGPGPVQVVVVAEVRGERIVALPGAAPAGRPRPVLLTGAGELAFDLIPPGPAGPGGRLQVQLDGRPVSSEGSIVPLRVGRGLHQVSVTTEGGQRGELRVEVSRPSYAVEIRQEQPGAEERAYRVEIRALDAGGHGASGEGGVHARTAVVSGAAGGKEPAEGQPLGLQTKGAGIYAGEVKVPAGKTVRLSIRDGDGAVASADLAGIGVE